MTPTKGVLQTMANRIICVGRQCGSGGRDIAQQAARRLGISVYGRELVQLACDYGALETGRMARGDERLPNPYLFTSVYDGNENVPWGKPTSEVLFVLQAHEIKRLAREKECVFVGRCADFLLRRSNVRLLRVFVSAPLEQRIDRVAAREGISPGKARALIAKTDKQRSRYYEHYTRHVWGAPENYDLMLDTGVISLADAVEEVCARFAALP